MPQTSVHIESGPTSARLETLADGIYAIAMTLLVLNIEVPLVDPPPSAAVLRRQFLSRWPLFVHYVLSFVLLGSFWIIHHVQFQYIKRVNRTVLWINIFGLMFVALLPFSTSFMADYGEYQLPAVFFHCNLFAIGFIIYLNWSYMTRKQHFMKHHLGKIKVEKGKKKNMVIPFISLICIIISFIIPRWSMAPYILIPFILAGYKIHIKRKVKQGGKS